MKDIPAAIQELRKNPNGIRFADFARICDRFFGPHGNREAATWYTGLRGRETPG